MAYARGKYAYGICDISGFRYKLKDMKKTWNGLLVGPDMYEPKHPQNDAPLTTVDAEALFQPRPEVSLPQAQLGRVFTDNPGNVNPDEDLIGTKFSLSFNSSFTLQPKIEHGPDKVTLQSNFSQINCSIFS